MHDDNGQDTHENTVMGAAPLVQERRVHGMGDDEGDAERRVSEEESLDAGEFCEALGLQAPASDGTRCKAAIFRNGEKIAELHAPVDRQFFINGCIVQFGAETGKPFGPGSYSIQVRGVSGKGQYGTLVKRSLVITRAEALAAGWVEPSIAPVVDDDDDDDDDDFGDDEDANVEDIRVERIEAAVAELAEQQRALSAAIVQLAQAQAVPKPQEPGLNELAMRHLSAALERASRPPPTLVERVAEINQAVIAIRSLVSAETIESAKASAKGALASYITAQSGGKSDLAGGIITAVQDVGTKALEVYERVSGGPKPAQIEGH